MRKRSVYGGRHELGQNFLIHRPAIETIVGLVAASQGPILEIGAGDGALTKHLAELGRALRAIDIDEHRVKRLQRRLPGVEVGHGDALVEPLTASVIVGNLPFHITTPLLRRLLKAPKWRYAVVLTQWEVARKRAGIGGATMMTAQAAPWFTFELHGRVPAQGFAPVPSVDGGILAIRRRRTPLVDSADRQAYERFIKAVFTGRGRGVQAILRAETSLSSSEVRRALEATSVHKGALARDLNAIQWASLWSIVGKGTREK